MLSVKLYVLFCAILVSSAQFPAHTRYQGFSKAFVPIVSQDFQIQPDASSYKFKLEGLSPLELPLQPILTTATCYVSGDGSQRQESGTQKGPDSYSVTGSFSYALPNGGPVQVNYVSDEFGYQPSGPGVHPDIAKAVAQQVAEARSSPHSGFTGGSYRPAPVYG